MQILRTVQMRYPQTVLFLAISFGLTVISSSIIQPSIISSNILNRYSRLDNLTVGVPHPPGAFHVTFSIGGPPLHKTSCLMNTVQALKTLALGEYEAKIIDGTEYRLDGYPEVSISVSTPKRKRTIKAKFIIWAILLGVHEMIQDKKFQLAQFELRWNDQVFGWVHIVDNPSTPGLTLGGSHANGTLDIARRSASFKSSNATDLKITNIITTDDTDDPAEARLTTTFTPIGGNLGVYDVFYPIMNTLSDMAERPSTYTCDGLVAGADNYRGVICVLPVSPLRTRPPHLEYQWLVRMVSRIPGFMVKSGRFGEIEITMAVDGVNIAYGRLSDTECYRQIE